METTQALEQPTFNRNNAVAIPEDDPGESGGFTDRYVAAPRLRLLAPQSESVDNEKLFPGDFVLGNPAIKLGKSVEIVVASVLMLWVEDLSDAQRAAKAMPKQWMTEAEARKSGIPHRPGAHAKVFVNVTALSGEDQSQLGATVVGEEVWATADWDCTSKSAFRTIGDVYRKLGVDKKTSVFGGVWRGAKLAYTSKKIIGDKGVFYVADLQTMKKTDPELLKVIEDSGLARTPKTA